MSIDLIESSTNGRRPALETARVRAAAAGLASQTVTDVVLLFGGWGSEQAGQPFADEHRGTGTGRLISAVEELAASSPNNVVVRAFQGAMGEGTAGERQAFQLIAQHMHPLGKLILHGYSAGAFVALRLCHRLSVSLRYFVMERRPEGVRQQLMPYVHFTPSGNVPAGQLFGFPRVDSLTIIDAAAGPMSSFNLTGPTQRRAWPAVRRCLNYYQTHPSPVLSHGGPVTAVEPQVTTVENHDLSDRYTGEPDAGHGHMDEDALAPVLERIKSTLGV